VVATREWVESSVTLVGRVRRFCEEVEGLSRSRGRRPRVILAAAGRQGAARQDLELLRERLAAFRRCFPDHLPVEESQYVADARAIAGANGADGVGAGTA
jgi:hypothetical protein